MNTMNGINEIANNTAEDFNSHSKIVTWIWADSFQNNKPGFEMVKTWWKAGKNKDGSDRPALSVARVCYLPFQVFEVPVTCENEKVSKWIVTEYRELVETKLRGMYEEQIASGSKEAISFDLASFTLDSVLDYKAASGGNGEGKLSKAVVEKWFDDSFAIALGAVMDSKGLDSKMVANQKAAYRGLFGMLAAPNPAIKKVTQYEAMKGHLTSETTVAFFEGTDEDRMRLRLLAVVDRELNKFSTASEGVELL